MQGTRITLTIHDFEEIRAEICNKNLAVFGKSHPVGKRALCKFMLEIFWRGHACINKGVIRLLTDKLLRSIIIYPCHASTRISSPQSTIRLSQYTFGSLKIFAYIRNQITVHCKTNKWIVLIC